METIASGNSDPAEAIGLWMFGVLAAIVKATNHYKIQDFTGYRIKELGTGEIVVLKVPN